MKSMLINANNKDQGYMYEIDNIKLVPFTEKNINETYLGWFNDPEVCRFNSHCRFPMTEQRALEYVRSVNSPSSSTIVWAIYFRNKTKGNPLAVYSHVGNCCLESIDLINRIAEFGIIIGDKKCWGKGIATKIMPLIFNHGFSRLNLEKIWLGTAEANAAMQRSAAKAGMRREGTFKKVLFIDNQYMDSVIYGITRYRYNRLLSNNSDIEGEE